MARGFRSRECVSRNEASVNDVVFLPMGIERNLDVACAQSRRPTASESPHGCNVRSLAIATPRNSLMSLFSSAPVSMARAARGD